MLKEQFTSKISEEEKDHLKQLCTDPKYTTKAEDVAFFTDIMKRASEIWGEDQIEEPINYIAASTGGLRASDLKTLIGEDWQEEPFNDFNEALGFHILGCPEVVPGITVYMVQPRLRELLLNEKSEESRKSFTSDIAFHLIGQPKNDPLRITQAMHLLLDSGLPYEAAHYFDEAEGEALRIAIYTLAQALKDAPDNVKETVWKMTEVTDINRHKLFLLLLNDTMGIIGHPDLQRPVIDELHKRIETIINETNDVDFALLFGIAKLRIAQNARTRKDEQEAQTVFVQALGGLVKICESLKPETTQRQEIDLLWLALKICQEMAQPKAIALLFDAISKLENEQIEKQEDAKIKEAMTENLIGQSIDMSKLYYAFPDQLREQFKNYSDSTIELLKAHLETMPDNSEDSNYNLKRSSFFQALGELYMHKQSNKECIDALTEAQIGQEKLLGQFMKNDGADKMSQDQLMLRLALSCTNHELGIAYRNEAKGKHEMEILFDTNFKLAKDCFKFYAQDGRVIHFLINAALELGDFQHAQNLYNEEKETYLYAVDQIHKMQNLRIDETLCQDIALIHTKIGQCQLHFNENAEAKNNLNIALQLWTQLANNTKREDFKHNVEAITGLLKQIEEKQ